MSQLLNEYMEALETATSNVRRVNSATAPMEDVHVALVSLLNLSTQLARICGVPHAIEPERGTSKVETE